MVACKYFLRELGGEETHKKKKYDSGRIDDLWREKKKIIVIGEFEKCPIMKTSNVRWIRNVATIKKNQYMWGQCG